MGVIAAIGRSTPLADGPRQPHVPQGIDSNDSGGRHMPLVNLKLIEGVFSAAQKQDLIKGITEAITAVAGENVRPVVWIVIDEVKSGEWAIGGKPVTTEDVHALAAGAVKHG